MRKRLLRGVIAAALAVTVTLPGGARPAQAIPVATIQGYINLATTAYNLFKSILGGNGGADAINAAVQQIINAIEQSKAEILAHMDALATAEARACARHHVIEVADIDVFNPDVLQSWAQNVTGCATLIDTLIDTVNDKNQVDLLGLALNVAGPIALAARTKAGFSSAALLSTLRRGNNAIVLRLAPACQQWDDPEPGTNIVVRTYLCTAYNGDTAEDSQVFRGGRPIGAPINPVAVQAEATRGTSRAVATAVLPTL